MEKVDKKWLKMKDYLAFSALKNNILFFPAQSRSIVILTERVIKLINEP